MAWPAAEGMGAWRSSAAALGRGQVLHGGLYVSEASTRVSLACQSVALQVRAERPRIELDHER